MTQRGFNVIVIFALIFLFGTVIQLQHTDRELLKFEGMVVSDNLKNQVQWEGKTYLIYGIQNEGYVKQKYPVFTPVFMEQKAYEDVLDAYRVAAVQEMEEKRKANAL